MSDFSKFLLVSLVLFLIYGSFSLPNAALSYGDYRSDVDVAASGSNFARLGFTYSYLLPIVRIKYPSGAQPPKEEFIGEVYSHFPPFPHWANGVIQSLGATELWQMRWVSLLLSFLAGVLFFIFMRELTESSRVSFWASSFFVGGHFFARYADTLYVHHWDFLALFPCLWAWIKFAKTRALSDLGLCGLFYFISNWITFEHYFFVAVFMAGSALFLGNWRPLVVPFFSLMLIPFFSMFTRLWHNSFLFGGFPEAIADFTKVLGTRSEMVWWETFNSIQKRFFNAAGVALPLLIAGYVVRDRANWKERYKWVLLLFVSAISWYFIMSQHSRIHLHTIRLFLPCLSLWMAYAWVDSLEFLKRDSSKGKPWVKAALILTLVLYGGKTLQTGMIARVLATEPKKHQGTNYRQAQFAAAKTLGEKHSHIPFFHVLGPQNPIAFHLKRPYRLVGEYALCQELPSPVLIEDRFVKKHKYRCLDQYDPKDKLSHLTLWVRKLD